MDLKDINKRLNSISQMTEAINNDRSVRKNLKEENPKLYFVREDLELTILREDMLLEKLESIKKEFEEAGETNERIENKLKANRMTLLRLKEEDLKLLSFIDANIKTQIAIGKMLSLKQNSEKIDRFLKPDNLNERG